MSYMTTPGDVLRQSVLERFHITQEAMAETIGVSCFSINRIINGHRNITADMALRLARATGTTAEFWLNLQRSVDLHEVRQRIGEQLEAIRPLLPR